MKRLGGQELFESHFAATFKERWPELKRALLEPSPKCQLKNPWPNFADYELDPASLEVAKQLDLGVGETWLDLCSAPGGKALAILFRYRGELTSVLNEYSRERRKRLLAVLHDHLPKDVVASLRVTGFDGQRWGVFEKNIYDGVLVDAPCSGERHLLKSPKEIATWSTSRSRKLAVRQHALLCAALDAVKVGGEVVYSTCSISTEENDGVLEKLAKSRKGIWKTVSIEGTRGEPSKWGVWFLPDRFSGGPMFVAKLRKLERI